MEIENFENKSELLDEIKTLKNKFENENENEY
jgi:hypothetical protein